MEVGYSNPWLSTITAISDFGIFRSDHAVAKSRSGAKWDGRSEPTVRLIDTPTPQTLTVSWCDARTGHYGYQTWRTVIARRTGKCVLTGTAIQAGDLVYSPRAGAEPPGNAGAMIAATGLSSTLSDRKKIEC